MLKSRLQKLEGLKYEELKKNIEKVVREIPKDKYKNINIKILLEEHINYQ